eukprot:2724206-Prymnesium_polylepis.1
MPAASLPSAAAEGASSIAPSAVAAAPAERQAEGAAGSREEEQAVASRSAAAAPSAHSPAAADADVVLESLARSSDAQDRQDKEQRTENGDRPKSVIGVDIFRFWGIWTQPCKLCSACWVVSPRLCALPDCFTAVSHVSHEAVLLHETGIGPVLVRAVPVAVR